MSGQSSDLIHQFGAMCAVSSRSAVHGDYTARDMDRLYIPPLMAGQGRVVWASENPDHFLIPRFDWPVAFMTWAMMDRSSEDAYVEQTRKLEPGDFTSGAALWIVDFAAPYGDVHRIVRDMRTELSARYPQREARWIRNNMTEKRRLGRGIRHAESG